MAMDLHSLHSTSRGSSVRTRSPVPNSYGSSEKKDVFTPAKTPTVEQQEQLDDYTTRYRKSSGLVLNAPGREMDPKVKPLHDYLAGIVEKLGGERLKKEGLHLRISLYSGDEMNAFMGRHDQGKGEVAGEEAKERDTQPWAVREFSGFAQDGKPMYELGWNVGNFQKLEHEEEVAFIVAHELTHLFEHHLDPGKDLKSTGRRWLSSQAHEAVADHEGVKMMARAGYNTEAALIALNRLFAHHEDGPSVDQLMSGLESGSASHHHEGVRIALAQGQLEMLRRDDPTIRPVDKLTPLPRHIKITPEVVDTYRVEDVRDLKRAMTGLLTGELLSDEPVVWLNHGSSSVRSEKEPEAVHQVKELEPSPQEYGEALVDGLEALDKSPTSSQNKVDAVLRALILSERFLSFGQSPKFDEEQQKKLSGFLQKHSMGGFGWKAEPFLQKLDSDVDTDSPGWSRTHFPRQKFARSVLMSSELEPVLAKLHSGSAQWSGLIDQAPALLMTDAQSGEQNDIGWLTDFAGELADRPEAPLTPVHKRNVLKIFRELDFDEQVAAVSEEEMQRGTMKFAHTVTRLYDSNLKGKDSEFLDQVRSLFEPTKKKFQAFRDRYMLETLAGEGLAKEHPDATDGILLDAFRSSETVEFAPETEEKLDGALLAYVERANHQRDFLHDARGMGSRVLDLNRKMGARLLGYLSKESVPAKKKQEVFSFLASSWNAGDSLPKEGKNTEGLHHLRGFVGNLSGSELVEIVSNPRHLNTGALEAGAALVFGVERPDFSGDGLSRFADKVEKGEIKRELKGLEGVRFMGQTVSFIADKELASQLSPLTFAGSDKELSRTVASRLDLDQLDQLLESVDNAQERFNTVSKLGMGFSREKISSDASRLLMDTLIHNADKVKSRAEWFDRAGRIMDLNPMALDGRAEYREQLEQRILPHLEGLKPKPLREWLGKDHMLSILKPENTAKLASRLVGTKGTTEELAARVKGLDESLKLSEEYPEAYHLFCEEFAEQARLQPHQLDTIFPPDKRTSSEQAESLSGHIRGLSALVALSRDREPAEQIHMIDYLMGRCEEQPEFLNEASAKLEHKAPIGEVLRHTRSRLQKEETAVRVMVANAFLAGPSSFIRKPEGLNQLMDHLLKDIRPEHQQMARRLAQALLDSQGRTDSLALAYVMAQKTESDKGGKMDEAAVLSNLFDAYGVPGIKFKQYLAFTSEFAEFREAFESAQDSALPLSYKDAIRLVDKRFDGQWPENLKIDKVLGSGSVNVAVRYENPETKRKEVISIARDNIEAATEYDFYRFNKFLESLTNTPEDKEKFGYLLGLSDIIRESVSLEMNKNAAFEMQQSVQELYNQEVDGWKIGSIPAYKAENMALFMGEAQGKTARRIQKDDPETYKSAMSALSKVEFDSLLGIDQNRQSRPVPLHANPDFHDGQVLIEPKTRRVTILDFGQAVPISNEDRELAVDLLGIIGKAEGKKDALKILNGRTGVKTPISGEELDALMEREDPMDTFVHLLSTVGRKGGKVPISAVHWVMGVHRQMALGEKIEVSNKAKVRNLTVVRQLGGSLATYNRLHLMKQQVQAAGKQVLSALGFGTAAHHLYASETVPSETP